MAERREVALLVGVLVLVGALVVTASTSGAERTDDRRLSTFRSAPGGALALYWALEELDVGVERRTTPLLGRDPLPEALAILAPTRRLTPYEVRRVLQRVRKGGRLVYVPSPGDPLLDSLGLELPLSGVLSVDGEPVRAGAHPWTEGTERFGRAARTVRAAESDEEDRRRREWRPLLSTDEGWVAVEAPLDSGRVLVLAEPDLLRNERVGEHGDAAVLVLRAAGGARPIVFHEYHHGYREGRGPAAAALAFLEGAPAGRMLLQAGAGILLLLLAAGRRFGAPLEPRRRPRRSPLEHVEALASVYRAGNARGAMTRRVRDGAARRAGRVAPRGGEEWVEELRRRGRAGEAPAGFRFAGLLERSWEVDPVELARAADAAVAEAREA